MIQLKSFSGKKTCLPLTGFCLFICLLIADHTWAQPYQLNTSKYRWIPPASKFDLNPKSDYSIEQQKKMYANMLRLSEVIHQTPFLNPPKGYEISNFDDICSIYCHQPNAIKGGLEIIIREYYTNAKTGKEELAGEGPSIHFTVNNINRLFGNTPPKDDSYFEEPAVTGTFNGFPVYNNYFVVITKSSKPLFAYVTNEQILNIEMRKDEADLAHLKETFSKAQTYQQWLANKDNMIKSAKEGNDIRAKFEPEKAKVEWERFLEGMRKMDSSMKADEPKRLKEQQQMMDNVQSRIQKIKDKIQSMSPEERNAPALSGSGKKWVVANKEFYNPSLPPSAIQVLIIDLFHYNLRRDFLSDLQKEAIQKLLDTLNLKSLLAIVE